jgi:hypothetical protein
MQYLSVKFDLKVSMSIFIVELENHEIGPGEIPEQRVPFPTNFGEPLLKHLL